MKANPGVWGAESAIHLLLRLKPHSVHSLPGNTLRAVALICMASMVQEWSSQSGQYSNSIHYAITMLNGYYMQEHIRTGVGEEERVTI